MKKIFIYFFTVITAVACVNSTGKNETTLTRPIASPKKKTKPPASFSDTLTIGSKSAVFYYPDSLQLEKLKSILDTSVFEAITHEYFYQFRYLHTVLKKYWPQVKIVEARNVRYLLFIKANGSAEIIDLDTKDDPYGLFVFDTRKKPDQLELTNVESEIGFYFK